MEQDIRKDAEQQLNNSLDEFISEFVMPNIDIEPEPENAPSATATETTIENADENDPAIDEILSLLLIDNISDNQEVAYEEDEKEEVQAQEIETTETAESDEESDEETEVVAVEDDQDEDLEESDEDENDWLETLLGTTKAQEKAEKKSNETAKKQTAKDSTKSVSKTTSENRELEELRKQVESLTQLSQFLLASVQLEKWIEETAKSALQMQEKLAQYGIQLTEDEISQAMLRASSRALQDTHAFAKEIRPIVAKKMAQQVTRNRRIPSQPQEAAFARRESPLSNQPQDILQRERHSFEEFVLETLDEIKRKTGQ